MSVCRTCLTKDNLSPIFTEENANKRSEDLLLATGVKIEQNDDLPQSICQNCTTLVNGAVLLRIKSLQSDKILKDRIKNEYNASMEKYLEIKLNENSDCEGDKFIFIVSRSTEENIDRITEQPKKLAKTRTTRKFRKKSKCMKSSINCEKELDCIEEFQANIQINEEDNTDRVKKRRRLTQEQIKRYMSLAVQPRPRAGPIQCRVCRRQLRAAKYFINHAKTHFEAEYTCETCGKKFISSSYLRYHQQRVHGAARKHACNTCTYTAVDIYQLQNHERSAHTGERPFTCDVCGDSFRLRAGIVQHMRTHFAAKTVQCERCPAMFRSRSELAGHRNKVHLMTYTYLCYLCTGTYKAVSTVKNHIVKIHGVPRDQHLPIKCVKKKREI